MSVAFGDQEGIASVSLALLSAPWALMSVAFGDKKTWTITWASKHAQLAV
jgi:hypothetical protein